MRKIVALIVTVAMCAMEFAYGIRSSPDSVLYALMPVSFWIGLCAFVWLVTYLEGRKPQ